jgi:streptomycin 6-kinase
MLIPESFRELWASEDAWLRKLPATIDACAAAWDLQLEAPLESGYSLVIPAGDAVLKLTAPSDREADDEADALQAWNGKGAVRLLARDHDRRALLIERCRPGSPLWDEATGHEIAIGLLSRLTTPLREDHSFRTLREEAERWADDVPRHYDEAGVPFERSLLDYAVAVFESAVRAEGAPFLVNQDMHGGNVLRAEREPWLLIDPKPLAGERELAAVGLLRNAASARLLRNVATATEFPRSPVRWWLDAVADIGFDRERAREWGVAHALAWGYDDAGWLEWSIEVARMVRDA